MDGSLEPRAALVADGQALLSSQYVYGCLQTHTCPWQLSARVSLAKWETSPSEVGTSRIAGALLVVPCDSDQQGGDSIKPASLWLLFSL